ncbi:MAG TPA: hypothetical protein DCQ98_10690 [Planctomycetaceae bacterium]|nr:hypothetical protein [Planctomycetaceae bacterium]HRF01857.1 BatA and WFA domain-containing protein [Pirellulaceae bacterium]
MTLIDTMPWWGWSSLAAVPPAIVLLYFLKLRRRPVEVPSTLLWARTVEDLHVNSLWQRLKRNLLLLLQLIFLGLALFALLRPGTATESSETQRLIVLIDQSASMNARAGDGTRLDRAKLRAREIVDTMPSGSVAMVIAFSDRARVVQSYTDNRALLRRKIAELGPTSRPTRIADALQAASGLANPPQTYEEGNPNALKLAQALEAKLILLTDGGWQAPDDFALGNLEPIYEPIGTERPAENVGIVAFATAENPERSGEVQAFAQLLNSSPGERSVDLRLSFDGRVVDSRRDVRIGPGVTISLTFDVPRSIDDTVVDGVLELAITTADDLSDDDLARAVFGTRRRSRVLFVSPGNEPLEFAAATEELKRFAEIRFESPAYLETDDYRREASAGLLDLIVFDRCRPDESPAANACYVDSLPPETGWEFGETVEPLVLIDADQAHPLVEWLQFSEVLVAEGRTVTAPAGSRTLLRADAGGVMTITDRLGFRDLVLGFPIVVADDRGEQVPNTDWPRHPSFPMFVQNLIQVLGNAARLDAAETTRPGEPIELRSPAAYPELIVAGPDGTESRVPRNRRNGYLVTETDRQGIYVARGADDDRVVRRFAVNLTDRRESDLTVPREVKLGYQDVERGTARGIGRQEYWKWLLLLGLGVLAFEWSVYRRRAA